jgi:hypothetical protein
MTSYRFPLVFWICVLLLAFVASRNITEFGRPQRFFNPGFEQALQSVCAEHTDVCRSVRLVDAHTWWTNTIRIEVRPRAARGPQALELIAGRLTNVQRRLASVELMPDETKVSGANSKR